MSVESTVGGFAAAGLGASIIVSVALQSFVPVVVAVISLVIVFAWLSGGTGSLFGGGGGGSASPPSRTHNGSTHARR